MAQRKPLNSVKQYYDVLGGSLKVELQTEHAISTDELEAFHKVVTACEEYAEECRPEPPDVREKRLAERARGEEWTR